MELIRIVSLVLVLAGTRFNFISGTVNPLDNVKFRRYDGSITNFVECLLPDVSTANLKWNHTCEKTVVYLDGWNQNHTNSATFFKMITSLLQLGEHNVCAVTFDDLASQSYLAVVPQVKYLGRRVGWAVEKLIEGGVDASNIHLIGFSIGAQACGSAGKILRASGNPIGRISGLDPAGPGFTPRINALQPTDAQFVDVIHTDMGKAGHTSQLGDCDFYPNGGKAPQLCTYNFITWLTTLFGFIDTCPHCYSVDYYAASVNNAKNNTFLATNRVNGKTATMGYTCSKSAKGCYDLTIKSMP